MTLCAASAQVQRLNHPPVIQASNSSNLSAMGLEKCIGGCVPLFLSAIVFDVFGLILIFVGIFANLRINGQFYGDFFIYTGSLIIFFSLALWLMWYVGNIQISDDDGLKKRNSIVVRLARKLTERLSQKLKGGESVKCAEDEERSQVGSPPHKASRVTWGPKVIIFSMSFPYLPDIVIIFNIL
uniref:Transmembrane protein 238-like n=1 Tax=Mastacembelus armatus TaxID=205130 RepID=A0A3Q3NB23_9TELE